ncbi:endonuclease V-like isoform X3 [Acanthaster planci]|uniref:Endonuclease V n=1 Tax=Acanthaster planci TaxID=133434 RepID=A0A8B7YIA2_ACAPL|nr:endonuclease V-like isoform X3 [Acanthaster planci]
MQLVLQPVGQKCKILRAVAQEHITAMTAHDASRVMANVPVQTDEVFEEIHKKWESEQQELKKKLVLENTESWQSDLDGLRCVGGVDVSFVKTSSTLACASLVVCDYPDLKVIYSDCELVHLDTPYIPGFLAFREVNFFLNLLHKLRDKEPNLMPQVILVDGNGILHPRGFGIASHLGVLSGIPCVGVAKTLMQVDGIAKNEQFAEKVAELGSGGDTFPLMTDSGQILGMALRGCHKSRNPIFVSVGHRISLETATKLARRCCRYRVAEPVRQLVTGPETR